MEWQAIAAIAAAVTFALSLGFLIWLIVSGRHPTTWPPKDWRAILALIASAGGAGVLTIHRAWLVSILEGAKLYKEIANIAYGDTVIIGLVLLGLGYAISRRSFAAKGFGASLSTEGGEDEEDPKPAGSQTVDMSVKVTTPAPPPPPPTIPVGSQAVEAEPPAMDPPPQYVRFDKE